jgi:DNA-binding XRE family transcriptional regulator
MRKLESVNAWLERKLRDRKFREGYERELHAARLAVQMARLRCKLGLTQAALAARMATSQQAVARLERGDYDGVSLRTLERVAEALGAELVLNLRRRQRQRRTTA